MPNPKVFISYSHDSPEHRAWVLTLATDLRTKGIDVRLDQWDLRKGEDIATFMERSIALADRLIVVCSAAYAAKADEGRGGVGYEKQILTQELIRSTTTRKFIPIIRNNPGKVVPVSLGGRLYVDFDEGAYADNVEQLLLDIHDVAPRSKPEIGPNPYERLPRAPDSSWATAATTTSVNAEDAPAKRQERSEATLSTPINPVRMAALAGVIVLVFAAAAYAVANSGAGSISAGGARSLDLASLDSNAPFPGAACAGNPAMLSSTPCVAMLSRAGAQRLGFTIVSDAPRAEVASASLELTGLRDSSGTGPTCMAGSLDGIAIRPLIPLKLGQMQHGGRLSDEAALSTVVAPLPASINHVLASKGSHTLTLSVPDECSAATGFVAFKTARILLTEK